MLGDFRRPTILTAAGLGASLAVGLSGKYLGLAVAPFVIWSLISASPSVLARRRYVAFVVALIAVFALINWQFFLEVGDFRFGVGSEVGRVRERQAADGAFNDGAWKRLRQLFSPIGVTLLLAYITSPIWRRRNLTIPEWSIAMLPIGISVLLLLVSRTGGRYNLPVTTFTLLAGAIAAGWIVHQSTSWLPRYRKTAAALLAFVFAALIVAPEIEDLQKYRAGFKVESRMDLTRLVAGLPATAVVAEEYNARIGNPSRPDLTVAALPMPQRRIVLPWREEFGPDVTLSQLRDRDVTHVVAIWSRGLQKLLRPGDDTKKRSTRDRATREFYQELEISGKLLFESSDGKPDFLEAPFRLYQITEPAQPEASVKP